MTTPESTARKILFATDGSAASRHAIEEALRLLAGQPIEATVVGVVETASGLERLVPVAPALTEEAAAETRRGIVEAEAHLRAAGMPVRVLERQGRPGPEIVAVAEELQPDLIVLGSHGFGPVARVVLGSVSTHVLHQWAGAILVVRPRAPGT